MFRLIVAGPIGGDETRPYYVDLDRKYTVRQLIDEILLNNREWGYIASQFPEEYLDRKIKCVHASGGWSRMEYIITLEE